MHRKTKLWILALALIALILWLLWGNAALMVSEITVSSDRLPEAFEGFRIAQISDLHNAEFGKDNEKLLRMLRDASPDIIVLTGDLVDSHRTDLVVALDFAAGAAEIAPTYFASGNHEALLPHSQYDALRDGLTAAGVVVLEDASIRLERGGESIVLAGAADIGFVARSSSFETSVAALTSALERLGDEGGDYTILLSHRPELFDVYAGRADLVLTGHAHGGQFRLPFVGGVIAPGQGLFPKYDAGLYRQGGTDMVVSRGLGNSVIPLRVNNRPEIVVVELRKAHP